MDYINQSKSEGNSRILNKVNLLFYSDRLNLEFLIEFNRENLTLVRMTFIFGALLYMIFSILDRYMVPEIADTIFIIRIICSGILIIAFTLTFNDVIKKYLQPTIFIASLLCGIGIILMIMLSESFGGYYYYAGLLLVIWYAHGPLRLRFILATLISVIIIILYEIAANFYRLTPFEIVLNNSFFIISANFLGMFSSYGLEYYSRIAFWRKKEIIKIKNELQTEYNRKTSELEEARKIQLSMLPKTIPLINNYDINFSMKTASEVGGDYYDYRICADGGVTIVLGDATGHGMRAGILVSLIKSLFLSIDDETSFPSFLNYCSSTIKKLQLGNLFMSMLIIKLKDGHFTISSAGMPPILIFRKNINQVEEIKIKELPLGALNNFSYSIIEDKMEMGDVILMMTDGFPELFDDKNEIINYDNVQNIFLTASKKSSAEISNQLLDYATKWRNGRMQSDDITFVVIRYK